MIPSVERSYDVKAKRPVLGGVSTRLLLALSMVAASGGLIPVSAETISGALSRAYVNSPDLNQQRAATRAVDENVPRQTSGYRPTITGQAQAGAAFQGSNATGRPIQTHTTPGSFGLSVTQNIWNGNRTINGVRQADSQVLQSREQLRQSEQQLLSNAAASYMNVLRDTATLNLNNNNVEVLAEQLRLTQDRFKVGEVTRTDVAQAEAALEQGRANAIVSQATLQTSLAAYRQFIGVDAKSLDPARPLDRAVPRSLNDAINRAQGEHPLIQAALHNVDVAALAVKINEGALMPTVGVTGSVNRLYEQQGIVGMHATQASIVGSLSMPLYDGGLSYSSIRQSKELLGQARLQADLQRDQVRAQVVSAWGQWEASARVIQSTQAAVRAAEIALNGVREEAKVGQRTTVEVLNQQQALLQSRVNLISAQRDRVVNSYVLVSAVGQLSASSLGLRVNTYNPSIHYDQVKGKWFGTGTPDGR
ncbi:MULTISPECIES: TolC family outer membrane protein [unclassified Beijerinckia]|uniref:TolC family outer membrane protein n=1 Tax=unclassified Beijerinckia TaxID=2638183 RepID=UPI000898A7C8|nr:MULTISPECIES: TolC family outer membrane protein [unclassified Beijerinckia]MDH7795259.1 outer membrane protein [Beijerinckia sp. GAS462]SEB94112.1 outer membrane protein [Beijerinckia sp. 28-YEA-48]